jgi:hypothetical protein
VFSENYLYTREGFQEYFEHLTDDGIFTVSRYYMPRYKLEILRLAGIARAAWAAEGIPNPAQHIVVLGQGRHFSVLAKRSPFTADELQRLSAVAQDNEMKFLFRPDQPGGEQELHTMLTTVDFDGFVNAHPFLIAPPTDDRPFFFNFLRGRLAAGDVPDKRADPFQFVQMWNETVLVMYLLIAVVTTLAAVFFFGPLLLVSRRQVRIGPGLAVPLLLYFACLGYGFMMIEVPLLQRFVLLLGYPVYALTVVLFALLIWSGLGSLLSGRFSSDPHRALLRVLSAVVLVAALYVYLVPACVQALLGLPLVVRIAATVALLAPLGLLLGMAYPLGITVLRRYDDGLVAWAWALNGVFSVVASVGAIFLGSRIGFTGAFVSGVAAYVLALLVMIRVRGLSALATAPMAPSLAESGVIDAPAAAAQRR